MLPSAFWNFSWGRVSPADLVLSSVLDFNSNRIGTVCQPKPQRQLDAIFQNASSPCINKKPLFIKMFIYFWGRDRAWEGGRHRIRSRLWALSCQHTAWHGAWTLKLWDHDLSWSQPLNWLSPPGAPTWSHYWSSLLVAHLMRWNHKDTELSLLRLRTCSGACWYPFCLQSSISSSLPCAQKAPFREAKWGINHLLC